MKRFFEAVEDRLVKAALLEEGAGSGSERAEYRERESLEENLIEVAFAEAADFDEIHNALIREHRQAWMIAHPEKCSHGDNDLCFV